MGIYLTPFTVAHKCYFNLFVYSGYHEPQYWFIVGMAKKYVGMAHKVISSNNQPHFSQKMTGQYWLGKTKLSGQPEIFQQVAIKY